MFYPIQISAIKRELSDTVSICFDIPTELREIFTFKPGQHLTLEKIISGQVLRRTYSLCTRPDEGVWKIAVKKIPSGKFSAFANKELKIGDMIEIMPPVGNFSLKINPKHAKNYVAFAAGSGITPVISNIKTVLKDEADSFFTLFYGNRTIEHILFKDELLALKDEYLDRFSCYNVLSREKQESELFSGRINVEKLKKYEQYIYRKNTVDQYLICGPYSMVMSLTEYLLSTGVDKSQIKSELFFVPESQYLNPQAEKTASAPIKNAKVRLKIKIDSAIHKIGINSSDRNILDEARKAGLDLPFSCKAGVCGTCKAKLINGKVSLKARYALEDDEIQKGFILTCQAYPEDSELFIDYDIKS